MKTSEVLERAADEMERRGKCDEGSWIDEHCCVCIGGAIAFTTGRVEFLPNFEMWITQGSPTATPAWRAMAEALGGDGHVHSFNRIASQEEVVAMMRAVALTERVREGRLLPALLAEALREGT